MMYLFDNVRQSHYPARLLLGYTYLCLFLLKSHSFIFKHHQQIIGLLQIFLPYCYANPQLFSMPPLNWATNIKYYKTKYFVRPIVHTYAQIILLKEFKSHDQKPWFKSMGNYLSKSLVLTGNIKKTQFSLTISKSPILANNFKKPSSH